MRRVTAIWICLMLAFSSAFLVIDVSEETEGEIIVNNGGKYVPHAPIKIDSNADFDAAHGVTAGNGSETNPWVIENYVIDGFLIGYCIYIGNTTDYYIVRNNFLHSANIDPSSSYHCDSGCAVYNGSNGNISNNLLSSNEKGITLQSSHNITIFNNTASSNDDLGIFIGGSYYITIMNNTISGHDRVGIYLWESYDNILYNNTMVNDGISIYANIITNWNRQTIDTSNTVNGKPVHYWKDTVGGTVPAGAGQVILANCQGVTIENQDVSDGTVGILLGYSNYTLITRNTVSSNDRYGFRLWWSNNNTILNNTVSNNIQQEGIFLWASHGNRIENNNLTFNDGNIQLTGSSNNIIANNNVSNSYDDGIWLFGCISNTIVNNTIGWNSGQGLNIYASDNNIIRNNSVIRNEYGIDLDNSVANQIYHNSLYHNNRQSVDWGGGGSNSWDNGYPSGGNYWDDYTGIDIYQGPNQDIPGSDGIGDTPKLISGDTDLKDNYPLMEPWVDEEASVPDIIMTEGWNLISLPLEQQNESDIIGILSSIDGKWNCIQAYDPLAPNPWKTYTTFKPSQLNNLQFLDHKMGFWINITESSVNLTVSGTVLNYTCINLYAGWNLVGYPSLTNERVDNALWGTGADKVMVCNMSEPYRIKEVGYTYVMKPGEGYWIHVAADTTWVVDW